MVYHCTRPWPEQPILLYSCTQVVNVAGWQIDCKAIGLAKAHNYLDTILGERGSALIKRHLDVMHILCIVEPFVMRPHQAPDLSNSRSRLLHSCCCSCCAVED